MVPDMVPDMVSEMVSDMVSGRDYDRSADDFAVLPRHPQGLDRRARARWRSESGDVADSSQDNDFSGRACDCKESFVALR
jgi:hypothetical protein